MTARYFCDGCDQEVGDSRSKITINVNDGQITKSGGQYDLCEMCTARLKSEANPKNWPRT